MEILKINPCVNEPKIYTGTFDVLVFKVILRAWCICLKMAWHSKTSVPRENAEWNLEVGGGGGGSCKHVYLVYIWPFSVQGHLGVLIVQWNRWV